MSWAYLMLLATVAVTTDSASAIDISSATCPKNQVLQATETSQNISSPVFLGKYPKNSECSWNITADPGQIIQLDITKMDLQRARRRRCQDYVRVSDQHGQVIWANCGTNLPGQTIERQNKIVVEFGSNDDDYTGTGFCATFKLKQSTPAPAPAPAPAPVPAPAPTPPPTPSDTCGIVSVIRKRSIGGEHSIEGQWPWIVHLKIKIGSATYRCGGTLIDPSWIVSAAHCFQNEYKQTTMTDPRNVDVYLGEHDVTYLNDKRPVAKIIIHPKRKAYGVGLDDIALLKLANPIKPSDSINPACLPKHNNFQKSHICAVAGWGTDERGRDQNRLMHVELDVLSNNECINKYPIMDDIQESQVCGVRENELKSACQGDSGGPFTCEEGGRHYLVGAVSFGVSCGDIHRSGNVFPTVFARIFYYLDWIRETMDAYS